MGTVKLADSELQRKCYENEVPVQKYYETSMWDNLNIMPFSSILININKHKKTEWGMNGVNKYSKR